MSHMPLLQRPPPPPPPLPPRAPGPSHQTAPSQWPPPPMPAAVSKMGATRAQQLQQAKAADAAKAHGKGTSPKELSSAASRAKLLQAFGGKEPTILTRSNHGDQQSTADAQKRLGDPSSHAFFVMNLDIVPNAGPRRESFLDARQVAQLEYFRRSLSASRLPTRGLPRHTTVPIDFQTPIGDARLEPAIIRKLEGFRRATKR